MRTRTIGDMTVSAIGLGAMPLSPAPDGVDHRRAMSTVHAALDAGVRLIDTADAYAPSPRDVGHNERIIADALSTWSGDADEVLVATKGGHTRDTDADWGLNGRPEYLRSACEASLKRLGVDAIGLYQYHRPDPDVPYAETVGALADLQRDGLIRHVGISNANPDQIREAAGTANVVSVQNEFSPRYRSSLPELRLCSDMGVAFLPYTPLGGINSATQLRADHAEFAAVAREHGVSPQQVALAWELAQSDVVIPIPGASRPETILDSVQAADLELSADELERLNAS